MHLRSYFEEINEEFYNLQLADCSECSKMDSLKINIDKDGYHIQSKIYFSRNCCIINTRRNNTKELTELVQIEGAYVKIAYLLNGHLDISRKGNPSNTVTSGKLTIGFGESIQNKVIAPANEVIESLLIYISFPYFTQLMDKEKEWSGENSLIKNISFDKVKEMPDLETFLVNIPLQNIINDIREGCKGCNSIYLGLKLRELLFQLTRQKPDSALDESQSIREENLEKIKLVKKYIDENYTSTPTIKFLSRYVLVNEHQLKKDFKKVFQKTIRSYIIELKMKKALELLDTCTLKEIAGHLGYQSTSHFITTFKKVHHCTPSNLKKENN